MATLTLVGSLQAQTLKQIATIDLPGLKGERFDYLTMDDEDHTHASQIHNANLVFTPIGRVDPCEDSARIPVE